MALEVATSLVGTPRKNDAVLIGLEDGRSLSLTFGTTTASRQWQVLPLENLPEVRAVLDEEKNAMMAAGDLACLIASDEVIAVGRHLRINVSSSTHGGVQMVSTMLSYAVTTITVI